MPEFNPFQKDMSQEVKSPEKDKRIKFPMHVDLKTSKFGSSNESHVIEEEVEKTRYDILIENGGIESNIPINSPYWQMKR